MTEHQVRHTPCDTQDLLDARIRKAKYIALVIVAVVVTVPFLGYCLYVVVTDTGSADDIKWCTSILAGSGSYAIGYLWGQMRKGAKRDPR